MTYFGEVVAVLVGGTTVGGATVGVSVDGRGVDERDAASVGGRLDGTIVLVTGVPAVTQPASDRMFMHNKSGKVNFLIIVSFLDQSARIIAFRVFIDG